MTNPANEHDQATLSPSEAASSLFARLMGRSMPAAESAPVIVEVHVSGEALGDVDVEIPGVYEVEIDPAVPPRLVASAALGAFHAAVAVYATASFEFQVMRDGLALCEISIADRETLQRRAVLLHKMGQ